MIEKTREKNAHGAELTQAVVEALENIKATDIEIIDVRDKTSLMDTMIIASGTSTRHISAVVRSVAEELKEKGYASDHQEGEAGSDWVLLDFTDLVLHVMLPEARALYDLESLWSGLTPESEPDM
ncbi:ribosome silencing factor [Reinekea marinisedimentorum]|uniref:Ribosomal silencing factor RsfS n=1 Tax=Reinekea marinisedimentorum TaxID=230495 RepID=A0A4R3I8L7_9GAMM|nr:ribosome silencing factor [Reinekea marinisedimentorum]TCS41681.1 ribosome-associated protein [Reinekea marinisedimentorum]